MTRPWHVCVLIPAQNEEVLLPRCLESVLRACSYLPRVVTSDIIVAVDSSTDRTGYLAKKMVGANGKVIRTDAGIVGSVRASAADAALERYRGPLASCWLAHTDADCVVPERWLLDQVSLAEQNVEAIAGTVSVDTFVEHKGGVAERFRDTYVIHRDGTHPHVHGANLGIRADLYSRVGGWTEMVTAEDHDLWRRIVLAGGRRVSASAIQVITSGRRAGRAPRGFAETLAAHNDAIA
jgi:cellulose synthase/poly-beta-1,6-N-acetylglucosamine synthase-like glycosyltransferase